MDRMWHSLFLGQWKDVFFWLPIEELIQSRQQEYYDALGVADNTADCTPFVKLMLEIIRDSLEEVEVVGQTDPVSDPVSDPVKKLLITLGNEELAISELMRRMGLSHKPTFRRNTLLKRHRGKTW